MALWIADSGLADAQIVAGISAAEKVLAGAGVSADAAYAAMSAMLEGEAEFDRDAADAWENAETAAFRVIFAGVERWPESAALTLR